MKAYRQFLKELPSKKVVFAFGRFQPPTIGHELLVKAVEKIAKEQGAAHVIYASHSHDPKKNPLPVDRKVYYLKRMFPDGNFKAAGGNTRTFIEVAKELNKKFKNIIMVAGSDRVPEYKKILEKYNGTEFHFDTVSVISAGERDPDSDTASGMSGTKMREAAKAGDFNLFKKGLPHTMTTVDAKRLMNEIRSGMGADPIKEQVKLSTDWLRESYFRGEIYKIGQIVESSGVTYEILSRGSNYLTVVDSNGDTHRKWLRDVTLVSEDFVEQNPSDLNDTSAERQLSYKGYQTKNFDYEVQAHVAFQRLVTLPDKDPVAILNAVKATDEYLGIIKQSKQTDTAEEDAVHSFATAVQKAQEYLAKLGDLQHHADYINTVIHDMNQVQAQYHADKGDEFEESIQQFKELIEMKFNTSDKIKVARIIADALGVSDVEKTSNPEQLVNNALRKIRSKPLRPEYAAVLANMLTTAKEAGIEYDAKLVPGKVQEAKEAKYDSKYQDTVKRVGEKAKQGKMKTVWVADKYGTGGRYKVLPVAEQAEKPEVGDTGKVTFDTLKKVHGIQDVHKLKPSDNRSVGVPASTSELRIKHHRMHEELELDESMVDSWKSVQSMDKGSLTGGKEQVKKHLAYLHAVHAHHKKFGNDTKVVKDKIESINRSRIAEETKQKDEIETSDYKPVAAGKRDVKARRNTITFDQVKEEFEELAEDAFDDELHAMNDIEHVIEAYDDEEFIIIDEETGEELSTEGFDDSIESETVMREGAIVILEISRMERIRRKQRFARTQSKREVRAQIALKKTSSTSTISNRARRMATAMIKKRLLRKDASKATLPEKERVEKFLASRKAIVDRLAKRVAPRIRQIEKARLQHKKVGK